MDTKNVCVHDYFMSKTKIFGLFFGYFHNKLTSVGLKYNQQEWELTVQAFSLLHEYFKLIESSHVDEFAKFTKALSKEL